MGLTISQLSSVERMNRYNQGYDDYITGETPNLDLIGDDDYLRGWQRAHKNLFAPNQLTLTEIGV